jgi:hypothetical protein
MPPKKTTTFKIHGPLFDKDAAKNLIEATNRGLLDLATIEGTNKVLSELYPGHGKVIGELRRHIGAAIIRDSVAVVAAGEQIEGRQNLIYSNWVEGIDERNRARPGFPGYRMFRKAEDHMDNPKLHEEYIGAAIAEAFDA